MHKHTITQIKLICSLVIATCTVSCASPGKEKTALYQTGIVSHYSTRTNSPSPTATASGIPLNDSKRTAAHKTLPFNTRIKVTRLDNPALTTTVIITDRGPYVKGRVLDVSQAAAQDLQMIKAGIVNCKIEIVE